MPYANGYTYRKPITITNGIAETFSNFQVPILVADSGDVDFSKVESSSGHDVIFTQSDGTTNLDFERVNWDDGGNTAEFAVEVNSIASSTDTTIYVYYGNSGASDTSSAANTFGTSNFGLVFHGDKPSGWLESSGNGLSLAQTGSGIVEATGRVGKAASVPGSAGNYLEAGDNAAVNAANLTIEFLAKSADFGSGRRRVYNQQGGGAYVIAGFSGNLLELGLSIDGILTTNGTDQSDGNWHHFAVVRDTVNNRARWYIDGAQVGSDTTVTDNSTIDISSAIRLFAYTEGDSEHFTGDCDELIFHKVARSDNWINFSKQCRLDQDRVAFGAEETSGGSTFTPRLALLGVG